MEDIKSHQSENNPEKEKDFVPTLDQTTTVDTSPKDLIEETNTQDAKKQELPIENIDSKIAKDKKKNIKFSYSDALHLIGVVVNIILAALTYLLFTEATRSSKIANDAVQEAKRSNTISEKNYELAKKAFEESKKSGEQTTKIADESLRMQVSSLNEIQKQFKLTNEPYLNLASSSIQLFESGKPLITKLNIENLGKYPCKVIECRTIITIKVMPPEFNELNKSIHNYTDLLNKYIINEKPIISPFSTTVPISENQFNMVTKSTWFIYFTGFIKYKNIITNKIKTYKFQLKMKPNYETENIINENIEN